MAEIENSPSETNSDHLADDAAPPTKKRRNLPGMPDPEAEVIALSPTTLMATNRFVCEICNKGFQRDQNLQLHRRGHNLPWKLRQRGSKEVRKRVYVCPEVTCIHHDRARALGDLTGIKKHFCRKHGQKKFDCQRCSKKYAVQSDWKAHMKTCGTREYRCDCGTLFNRRDSFITHRAFCDALAKDSARPNSPPVKVEAAVPPPSPPPPPLTPSPVISVQSSAAELPPENQTPPPPAAAARTVFPNCIYNTCNDEQAAAFANIDPISLSLSTSSLYGPSSIFHSPSPALSATALLQKAAQMGATTSSSSFLHGLWTPSPSTTPHANNINHVKLENNPLESTMFGNKPTTLDFLGLGMGGGEASSGGFSAFFSSIDMAAPPNSFAGETHWEEASERKPSML